MKKILIVAFLTFLLTYSLSLSSKAYWWDEAVYLSLARNLAINFSYYINIPFPEKLGELYEHKYIAASNMEPKLTIDESFRQPLFPAILSIFYPLGELVQRAISPFFAFLTIISTFYLGKKLKNEISSLIACSFLLFSPLFIFFSSKILTESLSSFLTVSFLYFLLSYKNDWKNLILSSLFFSLSALTRYPNFLFFIPFLFVWLKYKNLKHLLAFFLILLLVFLPFLTFSYLRYKNPFGAIIVSFEEVSTKKYFYEPFYFYFSNLLQIFGLPIFFSLFYFLNFKKENKLFLFTLILIFLTFSFLARKEFRYLVPYFPLFYLSSSFGLFEITKSKKEFILIAILLLLLQVFPLVKQIEISLNEDDSILQAARFLANKVSENDFIVGENYPVLNYITKAKVLPYPGDLEHFQILVKNFKPKFFVVDQEITLPEYAKNLGELGYKKVFEVKNVKIFQ